MGGTSSNQSQTQAVAHTVSTGVKRLTSAGGAYRVAVDMQKRAPGPNRLPIARVASSALRSRLEGVAGTAVPSIVNVAVSATSRILERSGERRQIERLAPKQQMAKRARRLPLRPSPESDPPTITRMPRIVTAMARQVRGAAFSPRAILAMTAAKIGAAAMIATTLATSVFVTAVTKAVMLMVPRRRDARSGPR